MQNPEVPQQQLAHQHQALPPGFQQPHDLGVARQHHHHLRHRFYHLVCLLHLFAFEIIFRLSFVILEESFVFIHFFPFAAMRHFSTSILSSTLLTSFAFRCLFWLSFVFYSSLCFHSKIVSFAFVFTTHLIELRWSFEFLQHAFPLFRHLFSWV